MIFKHRKDELGRELARWRDRPSTGRGCSRTTGVELEGEVWEEAGKMRSYTFYIIGSSFGEASMNIIEEIEREKKRRGLDNVVVEADAPRKLLRELFKQAKYYLHPPFAEHFGISVVEAMAAGLVPIVYERSGTCEDVVSKIDPGLCYLSINQVPRIIDEIEHGRFPSLSRKAERVAKLFDKHVFEKNILSYIDRLLRVKYGEI